MAINVPVPDIDPITAAAGGGGGTVNAVDRQSYTVLDAGSNILGTVDAQFDGTTVTYFQPGTTTPVTLATAFPAMASLAPAGGTTTTAPATAFDFAVSTLAGVTAFQTLDAIVTDTITSYQVIALEVGDPVAGSIQFTDSTGTPVNIRDAGVAVGATVTPPDTLTMAGVGVELTHADDRVLLMIESF